MKLSLTMALAEFPVMPTYQAFVFQPAKQLPKAKLLAFQATQDGLQALICTLSGVLMVYRLTHFNFVSMNNAILSQIRLGSSADGFLVTGKI